MHLGQDDVATADRHQRQSTEQDRQVEIGLHAEATSVSLAFLGHAHSRLSGARMASTSSRGHRRTPLRTNAPRNRPTGLSPFRHFCPVLIAIVRVSATAAADAPCSTFFIAGTSL